MPGAGFTAGGLGDAATGRLAIYHGAADMFSARFFGRAEEIEDIVGPHSMEASGRGVST